MNSIDTTMKHPLGNRLSDFYGAYQKKLEQFEAGKITFDESQTCLENYELPTPSDQAS